MGPRPRLVPAGDRALFIEFEERIDVEVNARALALATALAGAALPGVEDVVPAFRSVAVHFDPVRTDYQRLLERIDLECDRGAASSPSRDIVVVPVCYDVMLGIDLVDVARAANVSIDDVVRLHAAPTYRVFMLGFLPGFAYMGPVDRQLAVSRKTVPRTRVPAGSVAIAGAQTGVYPLDAPGGWQVIGRTPMLPYDVDRADPFLFHAGDAVRFEPIALDEYKQRADLGVSG
jgi:inhibitor of KinA